MAGILASNLHSLFSYSVTVLCVGHCLLHCLSIRVYSIISGRPGSVAFAAALVSGVVDPRVVAAILGGHDLVDESDDRFGYFALALLRRHHMRERWRVIGGANIAYDGPVIYYGVSLPMRGDIPGLGQ